MTTKMSRQDPDADPELIGLPDPPGHGTEINIYGSMTLAHVYKKVLTRSSVAEACAS
jgi:hypothetical protein